jgi:hypothetical protein
MTSQEDGIGSGCTSRVFLLLGVLVALALAPIFLSVFFRSDTEDAWAPTTEAGMTYLLVNGHKYILPDRDDDGLVDCLIPTGFSSMSGSGVYFVDGSDVSCTRLGIGGRPMSPEFRNTLSVLATRKFDLKATHTSCLDLDDDKEVDCVVNVHNPAVVLLQAPGAQCEAEGREVMTDDQIRDFSEILALEQWLRKQIAEESD